MKKYPSAKPEKKRPVLKKTVNYAFYAQYYGDRILNAMNHK